MTPNVVLVVPAPDAATTIEQLLGQRAGAGAGAGALVVRVADEAVAATIDGLRRELPGAPIGVVARTRAEALDALEAGADEAMAIDAGDRAQVIELIDRARLRGSMRAERDRERRDVAQADKLAALGTLVAGVAHEINNPLSAIVLLLDMLRAEPRASAEVVDELRRAVNTIQGVVKDLRVFGRDGEGEAPSVVVVPEIVDHVLRLVGGELRALALIERDFAADLPEVLLPETRFTQVLTNVLVNATHAMRDVKRPVHHLRITARADEQTVALSITDSGAGIPEDALERIFDPFYTTRRESFGTGLGLSISRNLMRRMGGDLLVESVHGEGATFVILVPRSTPAELRQARLRSRVVASIPASSRRRAVLVAADDDALARVYARLLGRSYDVIVAGDSREALELLDSGSRADAVLADLGASEVTLLAAGLAARHAALASKLLVLSDDGELLHRSEALAALRPRVLPKPSTAPRLVTALEEVLDG